MKKVIKILFFLLVFSFITSEFSFEKFTLLQFFYSAMVVFFFWAIPVFFIVKLKDKLIFFAPKRIIRIVLYFISLGIVFGFILWGCKITELIFEERVNFIPTALVLSLALCYIFAVFLFYEKPDVEKSTQ